MKPWLKRRKNLEFYVCRIYLIFDLVVELRLKEELAARIGLLSTGKLYKSCGFEYYFSC